MSLYVDYTPILGGVDYDPQAHGGDVTNLALYADPARTNLVDEVSGSQRVTVGGSGFTYRFTVPPQETGRYWPVVTWKPSTADDPIADESRGPVDFPGAAAEGLVVTPEEVLSRLGMLPADATTRQAAREAVEDAQADVQTYLNRPLIPAQHVVTDAYPTTTESQWLYDWRAWPGISEMFNDRVAVVDVVEQSDGAYTVTVRVGLDGAAEPGIRRYVTAHAMNQPGLTRLWRDTAAGKQASRVVTSVSAEGQSVGFSVVNPSGGAAAGQQSGGDPRPGDLPTLASLRRHQRASVYQRRGEPFPSRTPKTGPWWGGIAL